MGGGGGNKPTSSFKRALHLRSKCSPSILPNLLKSPKEANFFQSFLTHLIPCLNVALVDWW